MHDQPRLHVKPGVDLDGLLPGGCRILAIAARAPLALGFSLTITGGREAHGPDNPHTRGDALDIRTRDLTPLQVLQTYTYFQQELGTEFFTTLYEVPLDERQDVDPMLQEYIYTPSNPDEEHIHCQVRMGRVFPSSPTPV